MPGYEWTNTMAGAVGLRYRHADTLAVYADVGFEPTPVPLQTGRSNYVDNDRVSTSGGLTYTLPLAGWGVSLRLGVQAQVHFLMERYQAKLDPRLYGNNPVLVFDEWEDSALNINSEPELEAKGLQTNNPGWPGFGSSGTIFGGVLSAGILY